jgi:hypothetical protein
MGSYRITYDLRHNGRREEKITIVKRCYSGAEAEEKLKVWWQQKLQSADIVIRSTVYEKGSDILENLVDILGL